MNVRKKVPLSVSSCQICREFQGASEISSQEVGYHLLQLPLSYSSRSKIRISTYQPTDRVKMLKSPKDLAALAPESENIFLTNVFDRYAKRDKSEENVPLIDYVSGRHTNGKTKIVLYHTGGIHSKVGTVLQLITISLHVNLEVSTVSGRCIFNTENAKITLF